MEKSPENKMRALNVRLNRPTISRGRMTAVESAALASKALKPEDGKLTDADRIGANETPQLY